MIRRFASLAIMLCVAACGGEVEVQPESEASQGAAQPEMPITESPVPHSVGTPAELPPPALPVLSIRGQWIPVRLNGERLRGASSPILVASDNRIDFDNCQQIAWSYTLADGSLALRRTPAVTIDINPKPQPCAASLNPVVAQIVAAIDGAQRVDPAAGRNIRVTGDGMELVLEPLR